VSEGNRHDKLIIYCLVASVGIAMPAKNAGLAFGKEKSVQR